MRAEPFDLPIHGGALRGERAGAGAPALVLHGATGVSDYMRECAESLDGLSSTIRYTQRGTPPSEVPGPYTIESHMADALAILDSFGIERAWAIGHSWGGQLALHLLVAHPERLLGVLCIDSPGADRPVFGEFDKNLKPKHGPPKARLPALFVHGEHDPLPVRASTETAARIPGARVETIPHAGRFPWLEDPQAVRAAGERLRHDAATDETEAA